MNPPDAPEEAKDATAGIVEILMNKMLENDTNYFETKKFDSKEDLEEYQVNEANINNQVCFAIQFNNFDLE